MRFENLRHVKFKRAEGARGTKLSVSRPASLGNTGALFYTADSLELDDIVVPISRDGVLNPPRPVLARDEHRFVGEPIAVVLADDEYLAEDLINEVSYTSQPVPPVTDPIRAAAENDLLVHTSFGTNVLFEENFRAGDETFSYPNDDFRTVTTTLRSGRVTAVPLETRGVVACGSDDGVTIWCSTQSPHMLRDLVAAHTGLSPSRVVVRVPDIGGGFGLKAHAYPEELIVAVLAYRLKANLRWIEDRVENLSAACHSRDQHITASAVVDNEGRIRGVHADIVVDMGAYGVYAHGHLLEPLGTPAMVPGPYDLDFYSYRVRAVATNKAPLGAYRGVGLPVATLVHERLVEHVATTLRCDSVEVRRQNLIHAAQSPYKSLTGQKYNNFDFETALARVTEDIATHRAECERTLDGEWLVGQGFGVYIEYVASGSAVFKKRGMVGLAGFDEFELRLTEDGSLSLQTTLPSMGQGVYAATGQILHALTGMEPAEIRLPNVDTGQAPLSGNGTFASRSAVITHTGVRQAYTDLVDSITVGACNAYNVDKDAVEVRRDLSVVIGQDEQDEPVRLSRAHTARLLEEKYRIGFSRVDPKAPVHPSGAHGCLLAIHRRTAALRILRYTVADECGIRIDPKVVEGQVRGAVAQAISGALHEEILYDSTGQINNPSFVNYGLLTAAELPDIVHLPFTTDGSIDADEVKGSGEAGMLAPGPTIANAVSDALGVPCDTLPVRREWLLENLPVPSSVETA
ncbi:xanthine dehydrogenase family protein molybdopterin-binding subunit [Georgenia thermotolerans]|nr:xanthine dehydrogenase family protein molybdopterin-binding subunit [Georgenia thermotolerans]